MSLCPETMPVRSASVLSVLQGVLSFEAVTLGSSEASQELYKPRQLPTGSKQALPWQKDIAFGPSTNLTHSEVGLPVRRQDPHETMDRSVERRKG